MHEHGRLSELRVGAALSYAIIALQLVVAIIYTPFMIRLLGGAEFGLYSLVISIVAYLNLLSFGFSGAYLRFYSEFRIHGDSTGIRRLNGTFLIVFIAVALIAGTGGALLTLNTASLLGSQFSGEEINTGRLLFAILTINLALTFPFSVFDSFILAHERFIFQKSLQVAKTIAGPVATVPILLLGYQSVGMVVTITLVNLIFAACTVAYSVLRLGMRFQFRDFEWRLLREVSAFSSFIFINMVVDQVNWNVDKFIVGRFRGAMPVAIYGIGALFNFYYLTFSTAISGVFAPRINRMVARAAPAEEYSALFTRVGRLQFLIVGLALSGFVLFGRPFILRWAGRDYGDAYEIALLLMIPATIPLLQNLGIEIQKAKNLHHFRSWVYLGIAAVNVSLSIPLAQRFGGAGAAAATGISLLVGNGLTMNWYYRARVGLDIDDFWRQVVRMLLGMSPALAAGVAIATLADLGHVASLVASILIYTLVYAIVIWRLVMNDSERLLVSTPVARLLAGLRRE